MKKYNVKVAITVLANVEVEAESKTKANTIVRNWVGDDYLYYINERGEEVSVEDVDIVIKKQKY